MPNPWGQMTFEDRDRANRARQLQLERDIYQGQIRRENIENLRLQNAALSSSIQAMGGRVPGQSTSISNRARTATPIVANFPVAPDPVAAQSAGANIAAQLGSANSGSDFPSLSQIQGLIESSQQKAEQDFLGKVKLLQNQERQKQEEDQLSARNAATRMQSYQRQSAIGAWESALRGR